MQQAAQLHDLLQSLLIVEQFVMARGGLQGDRREDALIGEAAIQLDLHVARSLELLEDQVIHAAAGFDEGRREDSQTAPLFYVTCRAEETFRAIERCRVQTAGERAT